MPRRNAAGLPADQRRERGGQDARGPRGVPARADPSLVLVSVDEGIFALSAFRRRRRSASRGVRDGLTGVGEHDLRAGDAGCNQRIDKRSIVDVVIDDNLSPGDVGGKTRRISSRIP